MTEAAARQRVLWLSTTAFTLLFNVWLMLGVLGISVRRDLGLSDAQLEWFPDEHAFGPQFFAAMARTTRFFRAQLA